jgi:hypothetical protein
MHGGSSPMGLGALGQLPSLVIPTATPASADEVSESRLQTYSLNPTNSSRVMTAGSNRHWRVQLRNIGPPGSFAQVSTEASSLAFPGLSLIIPAGGSNEIHLKPREELFAIGSVSGVQLSIAASEELA